MPSMFDTARRWINNQIAKPDELIEGTPQQAIRATHETLKGLTPDERTKAIDALQAYATYYHQGRNNEFVPPETARQIYQERQYAERLGRVDEAKAVLERYGGAPFQRTLTDALERSQKERERMQEKPQEKPEQIEKEKIRGARVKLS